jgi:cytochrome b561
VAYGADLTYRFELAAISLHWLVAVITGMLLVIRFRHLKSAEAPRSR